MKNLKNLYTWLVALLLVLALGALPATGMAASSKVSKTLLIYETIGQAPAYPVSFKAYTSSLGYTAASGLSYNLAAAQEQQIAARVTDLQPVTAVDGSGHPLSQNTLLGNAKTSLTQQYVNSLAGQMAAYMQAAGAATAIFNYQQQVMVQGNSQPMYLVWQLIVDGSGRPRYGDAQLIPSAPNFVHAVYTSKAVAATLPASFAYKQAGTVQWQQVNQQVQPLTAMQTIDVNGAFDAPTADATASVYPAGCTLDAASGQVSCDPDYGLKCLINHASDPYTAASPNPANPNDTGCPTVPINGYTDFISLENANGASGGYLDYVYSLTPVYIPSTDGSGTQTAAVAVSVDTRTWAQNGYSNCNYGQYVLNQVDYLGNPIPPAFTVTDNFNFYYDSSNSSGLLSRLVYETGIYNSYIDSNNGTFVNYTIYPDLNSSNDNVELYQCQDASGAYHYFMNNGAGALNTSNNGQPATFPIVSAAYNYPLTGVTYYNIQSPFSFSEFTISLTPSVDIYGNPISVALFTPVGSQTYVVTHPSVYATNLSYWGAATQGDYATSPVNIDTTTGGTYTNTGRIGYQVQSTVNRYYVTPDGQYILIGSRLLPVIAPTQNYSKTVSLPSGADPASYAYLIIDPFNTTQTYDYRNDTVNQLPASDYIYVAPIVIQ
ncbi:MAG: hypothetical protein ACYC3O_11015 [Burkholderiales bacterium]